MNDVILRRDGTVVWRSGPEAGEQVCCTSCGETVHWLTRQQIADGEIEEWETLWMPRSITQGAHLVDRNLDDIGRCRL